MGLLSYLNPLNLFKSPSNNKTFLILTNIQESIHEYEKKRNQVKKFEEKLKYRAGFTTVSFMIAYGLIIYSYNKFLANLLRFQQLQVFQNYYLNLLALCSPFLILPLLYFIFRTLVTKFYTWRKKRWTTKIEKLKKEKEEILDKTMETEPFKIAKEIFEKFDRRRLSFEDLNRPKQRSYTSSYSHGRSAHTVSTLSKTFDQGSQSLRGQTAASLRKRNPYNNSTMLTDKSIYDIDKYLPKSVKDRNEKAKDKNKTKDSRPQFRTMAEIRTDNMLNKIERERDLLKKSKEQRDLAVSEKINPEPVLPLALNATTESSPQKENVNESTSMFTRYVFNPLKGRLSGSTSTSVKAEEPSKFDFARGTKSSELKSTRTQRSATLTSPRSATSKEFLPLLASASRSTFSLNSTGTSSTMVDDYGEIDDNFSIGPAVPKLDADFLKDYTTRSGVHHDKLKIANSEKKKKEKEKKSQDNGQDNNNDLISDTEADVAQENRQLRKPKSSRSRSRSKSKSKDRSKEKSSRESNKSFKGKNKKRVTINENAEDDVIVVDDAIDQDQVDQNDEILKLKAEIERLKATDSVPSKKYSVRGRIEKSISDRTKSSNADIIKKNRKELIKKKRDQEKSKQQSLPSTAPSSLENLTIEDFSTRSSLDSNPQVSGQNNILSRDDSQASQFSQNFDIKISAGSDCQSIEKINNLSDNNNHDNTINDTNDIEQITITTTSTTQNTTKSTITSETANKTQNESTVADHLSNLRKLSIPSGDDQNSETMKNSVVTVRDMIPVNMAELDVVVNNKTEGSCNGIIELLDDTISLDENDTCKPEPNQTKEAPTLEANKTLVEKYLGDSDSESDAAENSLAESIDLEEKFSQESNEAKLVTSDNSDGEPLCHKMTDDEVDNDTGHGGSGENSKESSRDTL